jgi:UDP-N-acetylmuramate--alanine ligase
LKIFFSGIGGSGVSAIAGFASDKGHSVTGTDRLFDKNPGHKIFRQLISKGISIVPQDGKGLDSSFDLAVFSTAVEKNNPDFVAAEKTGIRINTRPEYLAGLVSQYRTIAVAGTSGKSTTAGMLAYIMQKLGMSPNYIGGGKVKQFKTEKNAGNYLAGNSDILVIEACESDGTIVNYKPAFSIISNLTLDHNPVKETAEMFKKLSHNTSGPVITGKDDENLNTFGVKGNKGFSIDHDSEYRAEGIAYHPFETMFSVKGHNFLTQLPGKHNLYNALSCIALLSEIGSPLNEVSNALAGFSGIERRFDVRLKNEKYLVIDDYAHNPHKIAGLMDTVKRTGRRTCYIFQPHGYGPTRLMKDGYIRVFSENLRENDVLVLLPIYYAGGTAAKDISSNDIAKAVKAAGKSATVIEDRNKVFNRSGKYDSYIVFGARDDTLSDLAESIADKLR